MYGRDDYGYPNLLDVHRGHLYSVPGQYESETDCPESILCGSPGTSGGCSEDKKSIMIKTLPVLVLFLGRSFRGVLKIASS